MPKLKMRKVWHLRKNTWLTCSDFHGFASQAPSHLRFLPAGTTGVIITTLSAQDFAHLPICCNFASIRQGTTRPRLKPIPSKPNETPSVHPTDGPRSLGSLSTKHHLVRPAYVAQRTCMLVRRTPRTLRCAAQTRQSRRCCHQLRPRMGIPFAPIGQRKHRLQRDGLHQHRTLHAQRENALARRSQHGQRRC